jgi:hypothetical protein
LINSFSSYSPLGWAFAGFALVSTALIQLFVTETNPEEEGSPTHG